MCSRKEIFALFLFYFILFYFIFRMGIQNLAIVNVILSLSVLLNVAALNDLGYSDNDMMNQREFITKIKVQQYCITLHGGTLCM
jgi:hypothetical protein